MSVPGAALRPLVCIGDEPSQGEMVLSGWISACTPGEFEPQAALMLGLNELLPHCPQVLVDVARAVMERIPLIGIVGNEDQRRHALTLLCDWGLPAHLATFVSMPVRGMWVRDYGPYFAHWSDGSICVLDAEYGLAGERPNDDVVPSAVAALLKLPVMRVPLVAEGGNLLGNGEGLCITTTKIIERNRHHGYDQQAIAQVLERCYGFYHGLFLEPLIGDITGHVDMFATFVSADTIVVGSYARGVDRANAEVLDHNARLLAEVRTRSGRLRVVRIPMPSNRDGVIRTFTNVIYANGVVVVPVYPDSDSALGEEALAVYRKLLPGWQVVGVDAEYIIRQRGALRCMSINIPWLVDRFQQPQSAPARHQATVSVAG